MPKSLYRMFDKNNRLLYVGMTFSPSARFTVHARNTPWFEEVEVITIRRFKSDGECSQYEAHVIQTEVPLYNKIRPVPNATKKANKRKVIEADSALKDAWIIVDGAEIKQTKGHYRKNVLMVPTPHGPLYFDKPHWHDSISSAESHIKGKQ